MDETTKDYIEVASELAATKAVEKAVNKFEKIIDDKIKYHAAICENRSLGKFKATVIAVVSAVSTIVGQWLFTKATKG